MTVEERKQEKVSFFIFTVITQAAAASKKERSFYEKFHVVV